MVDKKEQRRGLGRGLSALMADVEPTGFSDSGTQVSAERYLPIETVAPNPDQPRRTFSQDQLDELAESIKAKGILQPLIVRPDPQKDSRFQIVAGERRWRAAQIAKLHEIPVLIRNFDDTEVLEVAIIENIQRSDLNAIEEAAGYRQLMDKFGHTQEKLAEALGKSRSHIANLLRLLTLPDSVQDMVSKGSITAGHARAMVSAVDPDKLAAQVVNEGLTVRQTEEMARGARNSAKGSKGRSNRSDDLKDADTKALEGDLSATLGMTVRIDHKSGQEAGQVTISYKTLSQLDALCGILSAIK